MKKKKILKILLTPIAILLFIIGWILKVIGRKKKTRAPLYCFYESNGRLIYIRSEDASHWSKKKNVN